MSHLLPVALLLFVFTSAPLKAQSLPPESSRPESPLGINLGTGAGWSEHLLFSIVGSIDRRSGSVLFSARGTASTMIWSDGFFDAGVLVGMTSGRISLSAGPSIAGIVRERGSLFGPVYPTDKPEDNITISALGLAVAGELHLVRVSASRPLGLVLYGFANVNREQSFGGLALNLRLKP